MSSTGWWFACRSYKSRTNSSLETATNVGLYVLSFRGLKRKFILYTSRPGAFRGGLSMDRFAR